MSIFWDINKANEIEELPFPIITEGTQDCGNGVYLLKAGTPISEDREVANSGDAVMLVAEDFYFYSNTPAQPKLVKCITGGYVDLNAAEAASGLTYADAAKSALEEAGVTLVDGKLETGGGSGGGGFFIVTVTDQEVTENEAATTIKVCDKTAAELYEAIQHAPVFFFYLEPRGTTFFPSWLMVDYAGYDEGYGYGFQVGSDTYTAQTGDDYPQVGQHV